MRNCGKEQGKKEWRCKFYAANGAGSDTRCANQNTMSQDKLRNGIPKGRETEEDQEPPGVDPQSKNLRLLENPGVNLKSWQKIGESGKRLYVTYALHGAKGGS